MLSVLFLNDGQGDAVVGHYIWKVMINDTILARGELKNHRRELGWEGLIKKFTKELSRKKEK